MLEEIWVKKIFFDTFAAGLTWPTPPFWEVSWCFSIHWYQIVSINANFLLEENWVKKSQMGFSFQGPGSQPPRLWRSWPKKFILGYPWQYKNHSENLEGVRVKSTVTSSQTKPTWKRTLHINGGWLPTMAEKMISKICTSKIIC